MDTTPTTETKNKGGRPKKYFSNDNKQNKYDMNQAYYKTRGYFVAKIIYYRNRYNLNDITTDGKDVAELIKIIENINVIVTETRAAKLRQKNQFKLDKLDAKFAKINNMNIKPHNIKLKTNTI